jgi:hypothetical protein
MLLGERRCCCTVVLRRVFEAKREDIRGDKRKLLNKRYNLYTLHQVDILLEKNEAGMWRACVR